MLPSWRSIVIQISCLVLLAVQVLASEYDFTEDDYSSEYDEPKRVDYTKYFGAEAAASGIIPNTKSPEDSFKNSFVNPAEFQNFFFDDPKTKESTAPQTFLPHPTAKPDPFEALRSSFGIVSASEDHPLKKDYFEESSKKRTEDVSPGPYYEGHKVSVDEDRAQSKDDVETIPPPLKGKHNSNEDDNDEYDFKDTYDALDTIRKTQEQIGQTKLDPSIYHSKYTDYNTGKSSSTVSQFPQASGLFAKFQIPTTTVGYQNSRYADHLTTTSRPAKNVENDDLNEDDEAAPSEAVSENLKNKNCRKINGPDQAENMNCFVCEDAANKAKYTQCSYTSSDEPVNQYAGSSIRYSLPVKPPTSLRFKRSPRRDPYDIVSQRNRKYFDDFEKEQQAAESERQKEFHYKPYDPEEYESYSETQSSALLKTPGACQTVDKKGMSCTVCKDPKTGGNFEQCSYASAPKEQKYAYVAEKKYDTDSEPEKDDEESESKVQPTKKAASKKRKPRDSIPELTAAGTTVDESSSPAETEEDEEESDESDEESNSSEEKKEEAGEDPYNFDYGQLKKDKKLVDDDPYAVPEHFAETTGQKQVSEEEGGDFDEYHYKLFPELSKEAESRNEEQKADADEPQQQDVEEVLAEFAKKDRSNCKKAHKNGMTCFLCVDENKIQHEECMYVAESKPKPTHVAFHEVQRLKDPKGDHKPLIHEHLDESKKVETRTEQPLDTAIPAASEPKKKKFKKFTTPLPLNSELAGASSEVSETRVPYERLKQGFYRETIRDSKAAASAPDSERLEEEEPSEESKREEKSEEPESPQEVDVGDEEGAYSHETKPVYSKLFGTTLPKYMVEKTEFEKDFDAVSGFN